MQRVLGIVAGRGTPLGLSTPVAVSAGHGIAGHPQGVTGPSHTRLAVEEHDGFMHVGLETPVQNSEVMLALTDLSSLGGSGFSRRSPPSTIAPLPTHTALHHPPPHIEELYSESEASSDGGEANSMMASADALHPFPLQSAAAAAAVAQEGDREAPLSTLDLLACTVTNMLNNDEVVGAITSHLLRDPAFVALMDASQLGLPAPARMLLLREAMEGEGSDGGESVPAAAARRDTDPLLRLLRGIQKGVAVAAMRLGEACCHLGNFLRGLGESLSAALAGLEGAGTPRDPQHLITNGGRNYQTAVVKVSLAVAVLVFSRRAALGRAVMA